MREEIQSDKTSDEDDEDGLQPSKLTRIDARIISDATIGLSDGLTVPFALTAGLSAFGTTRIVVFGGLAELIAGAISMGLGGYLGAKSERDAYNSTLSQTQALIHSSPKTAQSLVRSCFASYQLPEESLEMIVARIGQSPDRMVDFVMRFHHELPPPASGRVYVSAATIAISYFLGGFVPLSPYFFVSDDKPENGFRWSVLVMTVALFAFGYLKACAAQGWLKGRRKMEGVRSGLEMVLVGGVAAGAAMGLVKAVN